MSSHRAGLSSGTVIDRVSAEEDDDAAKRRINRERFAFLAQTACHRVTAWRYDSRD